MSIYPPPHVNPPAKVFGTGVSGHRYEFHLYPVGTTFIQAPGIYVPCRQAPNGRWDPHYVGEAEDLYDRLTLRLRGHHKLAGMQRLGSTHFGIWFFTGSDDHRLWHETNLRHGLRPPLNDQ